MQLHRSFAMTLGFCICLTVALCCGLSTEAADWKPLKSVSTEIPVPESLDDHLSIELIAAEPDIVTPISCRFDSQGRLLVVESHTHFPPAGYDGPPHDKIQILRDSTGDGRLDQIATFHEGTQKTMGMAITQDDWVYLATRSSVIRIRDTTGDDTADQFETLLVLDTEADYPHNGLSGLLLDEEAGTLLVGMGENFGADYTLNDRDGTSLQGSGEGGNIFECSLTGTGLKWIATGIWNPFGLCRDPAGRVLMVDNDPDARPPCRISEIVPLADYGFQFRFGRSGIHPLQAWDGELPGTLPMVAGTGEAPCAILPYRGQYWVTSWGDNRVERYTPKPHGATIQAEMDLAIVGGPDFRPVDMAVAADGSILMTDWVDRSYNIHGRGRIWRIRFAEATTNQIPPLSEAEKTARDTADLATSDLVARLATDDVFAWQWAIAELATRDEFTSAPMESFEDDRAQLAWLMIKRWNDLVSLESGAAKRKQVLVSALTSQSEAVRLTAIRWTAEHRERDLEGALIEAIKDPDLSPRLVSAIAAGLSYLETGEIKRSGRNDVDQLTAQRLVAIAADKQYAEKTRVTALHLVAPESGAWKGETLDNLVRESSGKLSREAARHLAVAALQDNDTRELAERLAADPSVSPNNRADIRAVLAPAQPPAEGRSAPEVEDLDAWLSEVGTGGDPAAGWRVFFGATANCFACHRHNGRGGNVGPDLTGIGTQMDRQRLLQSILQPSREMAPMYVPFVIRTTDGRIHQGLKIFGGGHSTTFLGSDGQVFELLLKDIEAQHLSETSIMPTGLEKQLTPEQLRNLLAFLGESKN